MLCVFILLILYDVKAKGVPISPLSITTWPVYTVPAIAFFYNSSKLFIANHSVERSLLSLYPSNGAELRFLHVRGERSSPDRGALQEKEDVTQIRLLAG